MRILAVAALGLAPLWLGCTAGRECRHESLYVLAEDRPAELASALLFDPQPARYDAQEFAQRSDWPSAFGYHSPGQVIFYSERVVDYQGRNWGFGNSLGTYRRADSYKVGVGYR